MTSKLTKDQMIAMIEANPAYVANDQAPLVSLTKAQLGKVLQMLPAVETKQEVAPKEETPKQEEIKKEAPAAPSLPLGYIVVVDKETGKFELCHPNSEEWHVFNTREEAVAAACVHFVANGAKVEAPTKAAKASVEKGPSAKDRSYELFAANPNMSSSELLNLVCKELSMDRKVASSYLCYYRKDNNIQATRGLSKEEKLKAFINDHFATDLSEGQMKAILASINEE